MIRNILVGLDGSASAVELAVGWAKRLGAELTGVAVVDDLPNRQPGLYVTHAHPRLAAYAARSACMKADTRRFADEFTARCAAAGVRFTARVETGDPADVLLILHDDHDVTLLPKAPRFRFATESGPDDTLTEVLRRSRWPVVAVPAELPRGGGVMVAYDGSPAAADALQSFAASGLGADQPVTVVSADADRSVAARRACEAAKFLTSQGVPASFRPVAAGTDDADALAVAAELADVGMIVMGAFSRGRLREWFSPSVTTRMLARPGRILYLHHHPN